MKTLVEKLEWRYATKKFDSSKKLSEFQLHELKKTIQLSASSYGLQPYTVLVIEDLELRKKLTPVSWNQKQVEDCSHFFVFCRINEFNDTHIDEYMENVISTRDLKKESVQAYGDFMKKTISAMNPQAKSKWIDKQIYIALGNGITSCAELELDSCPMEGFESDKYDEILQLNEKGLSSVVALAVGYRHNEDQNQHLNKVRKSFDNLFISM